MKSLGLIGAWVVALLVAAAAMAAGAGAKPGDIIVGDSNAAQVLRLKPKTGHTSVISDDPRLVQPNDSVFGPNGKLYVADYGAFADAGAVFEIDPGTGKTSVVAKKAPLAQPDGIARGPSGDLFVTDTQANGGSLFRVKLPGGQVKLVSSAPELANSVGVVVPPNGKPIVEGAGALVRVNPRNGDTHVITDAGYTGGDGLTLGADGTLYAVDNSQNKLLAIDPVTGHVKTAAPVAYSDGYGLAFDFKGRVITGDDANVWAIDPVTNGNHFLSGAFTFVEGLEVEPPTCGGRTATIVGTTGKDVLKGSKFDDVIAGLGGDDVIKGAGGDDRICGGSGRDHIDGGGGDDRCSGGPGHDSSRRC
jgi:sugar lactone lactonase YvrE